MDDQDAILFYEGQWYMFSNFAAFSVDYCGRRCMTSEHAYQAAKFESAERQAQVREALSAYEAKQIARGMAEFVRPDWQSVKLEVMEEIVRHKLAQHPYIEEKLRASGNRLIVEDSPTDSFWGRGPDWKGENHLGKIWMKLRTELLFHAT